MIKNYFRADAGGEKNPGLGEVEIADCRAPSANRIPFFKLGLLNHVNSLLEIPNEDDQVENSLNYKVVKICFFHCGLNLFIFIFILQQEKTELPEGLSNRFFNANFLKNWKILPQTSV